MIIQILVRTPVWVWLLFVALLVFGLIQTRTRSVGKMRALLLPAGMIALSLAGIGSSFGLKPIPLLAWSMALIIATAFGYSFFRDANIQYEAAERKFHIPGSWTPLAVMMALFFSKYFFAVMKASHAEVASMPLFIGALSATYGLLSGYFVARTVNLIKQSWQL